MKHGDRNMGLNRQKNRREEEKKGLDVEVQAFSDCEGRRRETPVKTATPGRAPLHSTIVPIRRLNATSEPGLAEVPSTTDECVTRNWVMSASRSGLFLDFLWFQRACISMCPTGEARRHFVLPISHRQGLQLP